MKTSSWMDFVEDILKALMIFNDLILKYLLKLLGKNVNNNLEMEN